MEQTNPSNLEKLTQLLQSTPEIIPGTDSLKGHETWQKLGPLTIEEIIEKSGQKDFNFESDELEFKSILDEDGDYYEIGMFLKGTDDTHGIKRQVDNDGIIKEGMY